MLAGRDVRLKHLTETETREPERAVNPSTRP